MYTFFIDIYLQLYGNHVQVSDFKGIGVNSFAHLRHHVMVGELKQKALPQTGCLGLIISS